MSNNICDMVVALRDYLAEQCPPVVKNELGDNIWAHALYAGDILAKSGMWPNNVNTAAAPSRNGGYTETGSYKTMSMNEPENDLLERKRLEKYLQNPYIKGFRTEEPKRELRVIKKGHGSNIVTPTVNTQIKEGDVEDVPEILEKASLDDIWELSKDVTYDIDKSVCVDWFSDLPAAKEHKNTASSKKPGVTYVKNPQGVDVVKSVSHVTAEDRLIACAALRDFLNKKGYTIEDIREGKSSLPKEVLDIDSTENPLLSEMNNERLEVRLDALSLAEMAHTGPISKMDFNYSVPDNGQIQDMNWND